MTIPIELVADFFKCRGDIKVIKGLPEDARLLRAFYDRVNDSFSLLFESRDFQENLPGTAIPIFTPEFVRTIKYG